MRKDLLPADVRWYRANLHCHTLDSDGFWPAERVKTEYKNHGYSIVAFSDHNVLVDHSDLRDDDFLPLASTEYNVDDWEPDGAFPTPPGVVLPPGTDEKQWIRRACYHFNLFSKAEHPVGTPCKNTLWGASRGCFEGTDEEKERRRHFNLENVNHLIEEANKAGFLVQFNHPNWSLNGAEHWRGLRGLWSLEILNWATEVETGAEYCPYIYDDMLRVMGPGLFCSMGDDNHNHGGDLFGSFGGSTFIGASELTHAAVVSAMERGDIFCASGRDDPPRFKALYVEDGVLHVECTPAVVVNYVAMGRVFRHRNGEGLTHVEFPFRPTEGYFRIQITDDRGNHANTRAYSVADALA